MKKIIILIHLSQVIVLCFALTIYGDEKAITSGKAIYIPGQYVMGSGGVVGSMSSNYIHSATAGETIVEGAHNPNYLLLSGFWHTILFFYTDVPETESSEIPAFFNLYQNYPNPFNLQTIIQYDLPQACFVRVEIFNVAGQQIRLVSSQFQGPGYSQTLWDGLDSNGKIMGSGIYVYRVTAFDKKNNSEIKFQQTKKMLLVK